MDAMCTLRKHQTRGEAIIRGRYGSLETQIVKAGVLRSDTVHTRYVCGHLLVLAVKHCELDASPRRTGRQICGCNRIGIGTWLRTMVV